MQSIIVSAVVVIFCLHGYSDVPTSVGLENMAQTLRGDVRLIAMGDSFSSPYFHRVTLASLRVWPIPTISAIGCGASTGSHLFRCTSDCAPVSDIQSSDDLGYTVEREGDETYFSLPTRGDSIEKHETLSLQSHCLNLVRRKPKIPPQQKTC